MHVASANGYMEVLEFLLAQEEVDLQIQDKEGWTPFHVAVFWEEVRKILMFCVQILCYYTKVTSNY